MSKRAGFQGGILDIREELSWELDAISHDGKLFCFWL
jgi:hypothetical protein